MKKLIIEGKHELSGTIKIGGAKNSVVALIPAAMLTDGKCVIYNVPDISDVHRLIEMMEKLGSSIKFEGDTLYIDNSNSKNAVIDEEYASKLRASYYFMGVLLAKYGHAEISYPGGCSIGSRPINFHLNGFEKLGASVKIKDNKEYIVDADELKGNDIFLDFASVGATLNIMFAAVKAKGKTTIENAAKEPEIVNVAMLLSNMGAKITGAGTSVIQIVGVKRLHSCIHEVIPDRIEAGTYVIIGALLGKKYRVSKLIPSHIESLTSKLKEIGVDMEIGEDYIDINCNNIDNYKEVDIKTLVYPGFPTDLQQPIIPLLTQCNGISHVEETIYENRFQNIDDTRKMGAKIDVYDNRVATIIGKTELSGMNVSATDLRGGASMLICGLIADGETVIDNIGYILRGYNDIVGKLSKVGAKIEFID